MDRTGVLYGTTSGGGKDGLGTVFKLTPTDHGWEESVIQTFRQLDGSNCFGGCLPMAGLTFGTGGTLYGTTGGGGKFGGGVGFSLTPSVSGEWSEQVLYHFKREVGDGQVPNSRLVVGESGALYGTTKSGGDKPDMNGFGTVFKLVPTPTGWREVVLHCFTGIRRWRKADRNIDTRRFRKRAWHDRRWRKERCVQRRYSIQDRCRGHVRKLIRGRLLGPSQIRER
ncbi:putative repeat protein (TIGR03803 family) [Bradyrhizobium sp. USDA 3311]